MELRLLSKTNDILNLRLFTKDRSELVNNAIVQQHINDFLSKTGYKVRGIDRHAIIPTDGNGEPLFKEGVAYRAEDLNKKHEGYCMDLTCYIDTRVEYTTTSERQVGGINIFNQGTMGRPF